MTSLPVRMAGLILLLSGISAAAAAEDQPSFFRQRLRERVREKTEARQNPGAGAEAVHAEDLPHEQKTLMIDGRTRSYLVHAPASRDEQTPVPLVIVFHGGGGNAKGALRMSEMSVKADEEGFIAVYPDGTGRGRFLTWNTYNCCGYALTHQVDDAGFIRAMIEQLKKDYAIDSRRIYATGLSNGGMMAYKMGLELSDIFAAVAPIAGAMNTDEPKAGHPVSVVIFHGTEDKHVRYEGGKPYQQADRHPRVDKSVRYALDFWARHDRCPAPSSVERSGNVEVEIYSDCEGGSAVALYTIHGQGHSWPGGRQGIRYGNVDPPTDELHATDVLWEFFESHPKQ